MQLRIFVIDDEEAICDTFKWHLEDEGHEVMVSANPSMCAIYNGCDCSAPYPCGDLLFCDQNMPEMTGLEFFESMHSRGCKGDPANKYLMSGNIDKIDMQRVNAIRCNVLQKPVTLTEIDAIVQKVKSRLNPNRKLNDF